MRNRAIAGWTAANTVIVIAALFPVLWILSLSLKKPSQVSDGHLFPRSFSFDNYKGVFDEVIFTKALRNSLGIALIATVIAVALAASAAYAIARLDFPAR